MKQQTGRIPDNHVIGVMQTADDEAIRKDLSEAGYRNVLFMTQRDVDEKVDPDAEHANPVVRLIYQFVNHLSEQVSYLEQYQESARRGHRVIAVRVEDEDEARQVRDILVGHQVVDLRFFGKLAVRDLTPETNPNAASDRVP